MSFQENASKHVTFTTSAFMMTNLFGSVPSVCSSQRKLTQVYMHIPNLNHDKDKPVLTGISAASA